MKCLSEKEVKDWFQTSFNTNAIPRVYFKKVKIQSGWDFSAMPKLRSKVGKKCDLWVLKAEGHPLAVFVPELSEGMVVKMKQSREFLNAPDSFEAQLGSRKYRMIKNAQGQKILVPNWCFFIDEVVQSVKGEYAYWRPELVVEKDNWYLGWAFYQYFKDSSYPQKRRNWMAFFRIDTQKFVSSEECAASYDKFKIVLSPVPAEVGNMQIKFVYPDVITVEFC